ncbi:ArsR/SmtB family transcription factor [Spirochaeta isovalerica]|uniref:Putative transcriptional regulator n=1 Tax=Spirochaeta isovalerica TaxID=150 RepID=A0A841R7Y8_9SPIO|nr:helix-turn-helix domain-containing protein [Spirochaeta isovalerica]MBB6479985.1 putative transcriptional regulator [Spirochaeta isovalerica]
MESKVLIAESEKVQEIAKALNSQLRIDMLKILQYRKMNLRELAEELDILTSTCTMNIQILEKAGLIKTEMVPATRGSQKICQASCSEVVLPLIEDRKVQDDEIITIDMPIGLYTDFEIHPPCGILSDTNIIDYLDSERAFFSPQRSNAQLIWFTEGFIEYSFPTNLPTEKSVKSLQITTEICSEFPGNKSDWPSDITMWINSVEIGTWTSPGDMGDKRGRFTPKWWGLENTQYGFLKHWRVTEEGSFIDGMEISKISLHQLKLRSDHRIKVRLGNKKDAKYKGGLNIFGEKFGNHPTGISMQLEMNS